MRGLQFSLYRACHGKTILPSFCVKCIITVCRPPPINYHRIISLQKRWGEGEIAIYLLMSSFASRRLSNGWRNGFVASGAALMAIVISLAAFGKSPAFDETRASARWLIQ